MVRTFAAVACAFLVGCGHAAPASAPVAPPPAEPAATEPARVPGATVDLNPLGKATVDGQLSFYAVQGGVQIQGTLTGLTPGQAHAFHIHEKGDCSAADGTSAGPHYNPSQAQHGAPGPASHVGDLGNVQADDKGNATVDATALSAVLGAGQGHDLVGKSIIVHAKADDLTSQPSGQAGERIACGVITALTPSP